MYNKFNDVVDPFVLQKAVRILFTVLEIYLKKGKIKYASWRFAGCFWRLCL
jgi:hypothetical protein